jgi:hypothetical protein
VNRNKWEPYETWHGEFAAGRKMVAMKSRQLNNMELKYAPTSKYKDVAELCRKLNAELEAELEKERSSHERP